ncbi:MAG: hypothetical protein RLZZ488_2144 [Pseudomonadota bacterium]|jgi:hypothetical protein
MNPPTDANKHPDIGLSASELASLLEVCQRTLVTRPELAAWVRPIDIGGGVSLPFIPIRCFRLMNVSSISDIDLASPQMQVFRSSGSTQAVRATHYLGPTGWKAYQQSSVEGFHDACSRLGISARSKIVSLVPPREQWPESSLAAMIALWKESGLDVHYVDVEAQPESLCRFFSSQANTEQESYVIFGTSLHLLTVAQWHADNAVGDAKAFINSKRVAVFDTGGSKGRTVNINTEVLHRLIKCWVTDETNLLLVSEYGMCELTSQAYTAHPPHDNVFQCSPTLRSYVIRADLKEVSPHGEDGFLAFIDLANTDSWPCIITEDLGRSLHPSERSFALRGRAPDATVKGCSLNVRTNFRFDLSRMIEGAQAQNTSEENIAERKQISSIRKTLRRNLFTPEQLLSALQHPAWDTGFKQDLNATLRGWNHPSHEKGLLDESILHGETLAIIASANIPITWLFPAAHAWLMGAREVQIFLPSVRQEDPISAIIRNQIVALAEAFNRCAHSGFVRIHTNRFSDKNTAERILIFGHDETIRTISADLQLCGEKRAVIGLGHFRNKFCLNNSTEINKLAAQCATWLGRGCLTPILAEVPDSWSRTEISALTAACAAAMSAEFKNKYPSHAPTLKFAHRHNLSELQATSQANHLDLIVRDECNHGVACIALPDADPESLAQTGLSQKLLDWGGCGWLTVAKKSICTRLWPTLGHENAWPQLWDAHQGKSWLDWLTEYQQPAQQ